MNIAIIILMILGIFVQGHISFRFNETTIKITCNWFTLIALILFLIKYIF